MATKGILVVVTDLETGETESAEVAVGDYLITAVEPCYVDRVQVHENGTHVVTIKGQSASRG